MKLRNIMCGLVVLSLVGVMSLLSVINAQEPKSPEDEAVRCEAYRKVHDSRKGYGYVDEQGKVVIPHQFVFAEDFHEGVAAVTRDGEKWGYINRKGDFIIDCQYLLASSFSEGL